MEEKFQKLRSVYTKLREEHIQLIRTKADVDKQLVLSKHSCEEAVKLKDEISIQMNELLTENNKAQEKIALTENIMGEIEFLKSQKDILQNEKMVKIRLKLFKI